MSCLNWNLLLFLFFILKFEVMTSSELDKKLSKLLSPINEISVHLNTNEDVNKNVLHFFLKQHECPVKVFFNITPEKHESKNNVIAIRISELQSVVKTFSSRDGTQFFILESVFDPRIVTKISRVIWNRWGVFKNYYITHGSVYFYNPFAVVVDEQYGALQEVTDRTDFDIIFENLNGYPLRTYIFQSVYSKVVYDENTGEMQFAEGADADVAYALEKAMNFKIILQKEDEEYFGHRLDNGSFDGGIGRSVRYDVDLTLTGFFVKDYLTQDIEFSVTVYMDKLCCYVSKAKRIPQSILPLFSVKIDMWLGFVGTAFLWAAIWSLIRKCNLWIAQKESKPIPHTITQSYQYIRILIDTWVIWVRVNIVRYPPFSSEKIFVISLCLVSVIFGAIFESSLATVYINPLYYNDINTLKELDESQLKILIKHAAMKDDMFYGSSSEMFMRLDKKLMFVGESEDRVIEIMSRRGGFASVTRASSLIIIDIGYILSKKIHQIPECPKNYHIAYLLPKESPYRKRVDELLLRFLNAGLINYWIEIMYHKARLSILQSPDILKYMGGYSWKELTLEDLQLPFYVVAMGSVLATTALIGELCIAWWKADRNKIVISQ